MKISPNSLCPCFSNLKYKKCCKKYHDGENPKSALDLMKSRYSAYASSNSEYIISTTYKTNTDFTHNFNQWSEEILLFCRNTHFEKLDILDYIQGQSESFVTFKATLFQNKNDISFIEKSRFLKEDDKWYYVSGEFLD